MTDTGSTSPTALAPPAHRLADNICSHVRAWGIASRDLAAFEASSGAEAMVAGLAEVRALGGQALLLATPREASATLDPGELREAAAEAARLGIDILTGFGAMHPDRLDWAEMDSLLRAGQDLDVAEFHTTFGVVADRFREEPSWRGQLDAGVEPLRRVLDRTAAHIVMRTHEEMTTFELGTLLDAVDDDRLRIGFSPVNVVVRLEDPIAALGRIRERIASVFLDDCWLARTPDGLSRRLCLLTEGIVPWDEILALLPSSALAIVDIHRAQFDMPIYTPGWINHQPDLTLTELAEVWRHTTGQCPEQVSHIQRRKRARSVLELAATARSLHRDG